MASTYQYDPLPIHDSIRLISFTPEYLSSGGECMIKLSIHNLTSAPPYQCLSYMWANPTSQYSESFEVSKIVYESTGEINIDGCTFTVNYNLHDALEMLRCQVLESKESPLFWVDAICINQKNLEERAAQVGIMNRIYQSTEKVVVWVGQDDEFTSTAIDAIKVLGNIPRERYSEIKITDWYEQYEVLPRIGIEALDWKNWLSLLAFVNRPFFSRIWIVQEMIFARQVDVICGHMKLPWTWLSNMVAFLEATNWFQYATVLFFRNLPRVMLAGTHSEYRHILEDKKLALAQPLLHIEQIRTNTAKSGHASLFRFLLTVFRKSDATDARDKIYALLNLAWKERPPFSTHPEVLVPNYKSEPREVYIKTARVMIKSYNDLRILGHVEDEKDRKMQGLPSWVPDFSSSITGGGALRTTYSFNACKGLVFSLDSSSYEEAVLQASGFELSRVQDVAPRFPENVWDEEVGELDEHYTKIFEFASEIGNVQLSTLSASVTRTEILWRTFCGDVVAYGQYPAPPDVAEEFFRFVCLWCMARRYIYEENLYRQFPDMLPSPGGKSWEKLLRPLKKLFEQEPTTSLFHTEVFMSQFAAAIEGIDEHRDLEWVRATFNRWWTATAMATGGSRRYLQDAERRLCVGPYASEIGDEIWIVAGLNAPCMLRKVESGKYKFLGEVYIHGVMNGELADHNQLKSVSEINLV